MKDECRAVDNAVYEAQHATNYSHGDWKYYIRYLDNALEWWMKRYANERSETDTHR